MLGIIDGGIEILPDGSRTLKPKTWDLVGNIYLKEKRKKQMALFGEVHEERDSSDEELLSAENVVRLKRLQTRPKSDKKSKEKRGSKDDG